MTAPVLLCGMALVQQVDQIAPPAPVSATVRTEQVQPTSRVVDIPQLPAEPRAVTQPAPRPATAAMPTEEDVARTYLQVLGARQDTTPEATARELGPATIARLAAEAAAPANPASNPAPPTIPSAP